MVHDERDWAAGADRRELLDLRATIARQSAALAEAAEYIEATIKMRTPKPIPQGTFILKIPSDEWVAYSKLEQETRAAVLAIDEVMK